MKSLGSYFPNGNVCCSHVTPTIPLITTLTTEKCNINAKYSDIWLLLPTERQQCCGNTCVCVVLTRVDRMKTDCLITKPWWRQAVRLKPTGSSCRCCQRGEAQLKANQKGCLRALEGNHLGVGGTLQAASLVVELHPRVSPVWQSTQQQTAAVLWPRCTHDGSGVEQCSRYVIIMTNRACLR